MGAAAGWKPSADHPLLLQLADDFDRHLVRDDIERTEPTETPPSALSPRPGSARAATRRLDVQLGHGRRRVLVAGGDGVGLSVGPVADRDRPLCSLVSELRPGLDQLVEVPLRDWTKRAAEAPKKLLPEQREVDQLQQPRLELVANLAAPWLDAELALLHVRVVVTLGAFAWEAPLPSDPASAKPK